MPEQARDTSSGAWSRPTVSDRAIPRVSYRTLGPGGDLQWGGMGAEGARSIFDGALAGRSINLKKLAQYSKPPTKSEWDSLQKAEIETSLDVTGDPKTSGVNGESLRMTDFLVPIMGNEFAAKDFKERTDEEKEKLFLKNNKNFLKIQISISIKRYFDCECCLRHQVQKPYIVENELIIVTKPRVYDDTGFDIKYNCN